MSQSLMAPPLHLCINNWHVKLRLIQPPLMQCTHKGLYLALKLAPGSMLSFTRVYTIPNLSNKLSSLPSKKRLLKSNHQSDENERSSNDGIEIQPEITNQRLVYQQRTNRESKFVILAGDDQVSFLAIHKPFQANNIV
ncbi:hypothetical protein ACHQM5_028651 [Ranunculus cassubicifolius]